MAPSSAPTWTGGIARRSFPKGATFTPKQLQLEKENGKLYWWDREGMRVMRANLDGSSIETLVETGTSDTDRRDADEVVRRHRRRSGRGQIYWTQKGPDDAGSAASSARISRFRQGRARRTARDIEVLFDGLPEPIDLELDLKNRVLYWTDRGDPRAATRSIAPRWPWIPRRGRPRRFLFTHLMEGIGIALDFEGGRMFLTDLAGSVYSARLDGSGKQTLLYAQGNLTGIAYA